MTFYIIILAFELLLCLAIANTPQKNSNSLLKFFMFFLFTIASLRATTVGGDLERYLPTFHDTAKCDFWNVVLGVDGWHEWGFSVYERIIAAISETDRAFIVGTSLLFITLSYYAIKSNSNNKILSLFLFTGLMYFGSFNIIRASISIAIGLLLLHSVENRNLRMFSIGVLCAALVQKTSIAMFPLYFLWGLHYNWKRIGIILGIVLFLTFTLTGSGVVDMLNFYFEYQIKDEGEGDMWSEQASGLTNMAIFLMLSTFILMRIYNGYGKQDLKMEFYIYVMMVASCFQCFSSLFMLMNRLSLFYYSYLIVAIPYFVEKTNRKHKSLLLIYFVIAILVMCILGFTHDVHGIIPFNLL